MSDKTEVASDSRVQAQSSAVKTNTPHVEPTFNPAFIAVLKKYFSIEIIKEKIRVTPKGLFVEHSLKEKLIESYQAWLESEGLPPAARTTEKVNRRIFASENAPLYYLAEGKNNMAGFLAVAVVQQPQQYHLPYFLGSLADSRTVLSTQDPLFSEIPGLSASQTSKGLQVTLDVHGVKLQLLADAVKDFVAKAQHSSRTMRDFPTIKDSPSESLRALATLLSKSRAVGKEKTGRLIPFQLLKQKDLSVRTLGNYEFFFNQKQELLLTLELKAKNLAHFVWREMIESRQRGEKRIGIFDLAAEKDRNIGTFNIKGRRIRLATHALAGFVEHLPDSPEKRDHFSKNYSVRECFEKFSVLFQTAQSMDGRLIQTFVGDFKQRGTQFFVNGPWIFVVAPDKLLSHCLARHARPRNKGK
jgi:hypothetical protein